MATTEEIRAFAERIPAIKVTRPLEHQDGRIEHVEVTELHTHPIEAYHLREYLLQVLGENAGLRDQIAAANQEVAFLRGELERFRVQALAGTQVNLNDGRVLNIRARLEMEDVTPEPEPEPDGGPVECVNCGRNTYDEEAEYCSYCGAAL